MVDALGAEVVKQRAAKRDGEAQFSWRSLLVGRADKNEGGSLGEGGRSPMADVGLALCTAQFTVAR